MKYDEKNKKIIKLIILLINISFIILIATLIYLNITKTNKLKSNLKNNKYKIDYIDNIYKKTLKKNNINTSFKFNIKTNQLTKSIHENSQFINKTIVLTNQKEAVELNYTSFDTNGCKIKQKATFNKEFKCEINYINKKECTSKCDEILKEIKQFKKEYNKITKNI